MEPVSCDIMRCEYMAFRYLPAMRAEMVTRLIRERGMSQSDAARRLGISRAAVSQYLSRKRGGTDIEISQELDALIEQWAMAVIGDECHITLCDVCRCACRIIPSSAPLSHEIIIPGNGQDHNHCGADFTKL